MRAAFTGTGGRPGHPRRPGLAPRRRRLRAPRPSPGAHRALQPLESGQGRGDQWRRVPKPQLQPFRLAVDLADGAVVRRLGAWLARPVARHHGDRPVQSPVGRAEPPDRAGRVPAAGQLRGRLRLAQCPAPGPEPSSYTISNTPRRRLGITAARAGRPAGLAFGDALTAMPGMLVAC
jgi:hypothetical protein